MAELTFVGVLVIVWLFVIVLVCAALGTLTLTVHVIRIETRYFMRKRRHKKARREMLERQARTRRQKELTAKDDKFYADIEGIFNES